MLGPLLIAVPALLLGTRPTLRSSQPRRVPAAISVAVVPAVAGNRAALAAAPQFPHTWVPLATTFELDPDRPTPVRFLGLNYIAYRDNDGEWVVMEDACPHRLAPLSEGRIDREKDRIECAYHGWAFESSGACVRIPQATDAVAAASLTSPRACVASYPTRVEKSVLWAWVWPEDLLTVVGDPAAQPETMLAGVDPDAATYTRDLPYGWDTLLEVSALSHRPPSLTALPLSTARPLSLRAAPSARASPSARAAHPRASPSAMGSHRSLPLPTARRGRISSTHRTSPSPTTGSRASVKTPYPST